MSGSPVRVEAKAIGDRRFKRLGKALGLTRYDVMARMIELWSIATSNERECADLFDVGDVFELEPTAAAKAIVDADLGRACDCDRADCLRFAGGWRLGPDGWCNKKAKTAKANGSKGGRPPKKPSRLSKETQSHTQSETQSDTNPVSFTKPSSEKERERENEPEPEKEQGGSGGFDWELAYQHYPRKEGKSQGMKALADRRKKKLCTTQAEYDRLVECCRWMGGDDGKGGAWHVADLSYCPLWSSFVNQRRWMDERWPKPKGADASPSDPYAGVKMLGGSQ